MGSFREDPTNNKISVVFSAGTKVKFIKGMNRLGLTATEFVLYLLDHYEGDSIKVLQNYRYVISRRIKKGIDYRVVDELKKIKELVDTTLKYID